ncbi:urocanate hydratase [Candidatus Fermentibacteria bacterium]|nr:urocanate hydratase [Candidatus Fermentibacteria bacterium]
MDTFKQNISRGIPDRLPPEPEWDDSVSHAPSRPDVLTPHQRMLAVSNALRYFPPEWHPTLAPEFARELSTRGRIYMYRFRPDYEMRARHIDEYPCRCRQAAAIMLMIQNNLDPSVAQYPHELVTYGGNGTVFQNWAQYLLTMRYLSEMTDEQTLVMNSGHPMGLFPSSKDSPRAVVSNGMVIPNHSTMEDYHRMAALGVTSYGQMTAGSYMYIGPQGIVHGTTITMLGAGRRYLGLSPDDDLSGKLFVSSGLGGMSGAQAKASVIAGAVGVIAEVDPKALRKRLDQGWLQEAENDLDRILSRVDTALSEKRPLSLGYRGNVVDLWEALDREGFEVDLGSDQTSLHNPYSGGYYPVGLTMEQSREMMRKDPQGFREAVHESLRRQVRAINGLTDRGMSFWDYGNAFLLQSSRAGADITLPDGHFRYPSYVEDIMGPLCFDYGFGPFRWVCTSCDPADLRRTDRIAASVLKEASQKAGPRTRQQVVDNLRWIEQAEENELVVGSQARILYADRDGRRRIAAAFNRAIAEGSVSAPIVLGRDHHDTSGTDSPFRETSNIYDGSMFTADMAVQNVIGDAFRGATWVALHNGGGVGWGEVVNGGFGLVLDGTEKAGERADRMLSWDVANGLARRSWAGNEGALYAAAAAADGESGMIITMPSKAGRGMVSDAIREAFGEG